LAYSESETQFGRDEWTVKYFSPSPILIRKNLIRSSPVRKLFENHQSDPVLFRPCKTMNFYFASSYKNTTGAIWPFDKHGWLKAKEFQHCFSLVKQNRHSLLAYPKFNYEVSILPHVTRALLELFCH